MKQHLGKVTLLVSDYEEALAFFVGKLRFTLLEDSALGGGKRWVVVAAGAMEIVRYCWQRPMVCYNSSK